MFGGSSIKLARVFGIRIGVDVSWFFVFFLVIYWLTGNYSDSLGSGKDTEAFLLGVISAILLFGSIVLHELGHALAARRLGIAIASIDLWLFGGLAKMERDTRTAGEEFKVAAAGPAVTLVIAAVCFAAASLIAGADQALDATGVEGSRLDPVVAVLGWVALVNVSLLIFNLIPGYPLDGGRIARSIVWWRTGDRTRATRTATRLGRGVSYLMIGGGVFIAIATGDVFGGIWLAVIGMFLGSAARQSEFQNEVQSRIEGVRVADVMDAEPVAIHSELSLDRAWDDFFLRYGWPWFPVVDAAGRLVGVVASESVESVPEQVRPSRNVASVMAADDAGAGLRVGFEEPLEALLGREGLARLGAIMAVDREGVLRGVVTADRVRQALRPVAP
ncbi:MAG TPA: site-2 protease family protein [Thermoleophilaceae bacterium]|nr:site-2 protease family protein [Thermoleophilaceae bacterium]